MAKPLILLIDGCSASGKSSFKNALLQDTGLDLQYVKRYTTRKPRPDDAGNDDYIFISEPEFEAMVEAGEFAEYRHYLFGMAYGLRTDDLREVTESGRNALGLMNLGAVDMARNSLPDATIVLIDAPLKAIETRLRNRGYHTEEQISERLENARSVREFKSKYDFVVRNEDGEFESAYQSLINYINETRSQASPVGA